MEYAGTGWEGTTWKRRPALRTGFGRNLRTAARDADKRAAAMVFVVLFPLVVMLAVLIAASPVAAGSCSVEAWAPTHEGSLSEPRGRAVAQCRSAGDHNHWVWAELRKDVLGPSNKYVSSNGRWSNNATIVVRTSGWAGPGYYYTRAGVRWQDYDVSRNIYWG